jgi:protein pelota
VQDVVGLGAIDKLVGDLQLSREVKLMEEVLMRISQDGAVAYGMREVADAIGYGAAEQVLITDTMLRDAAVMRLIEKAEGMRSSITVLSGSFEPGERLDALGGIAALLRYKMGKQG